MTTQPLLGKGERSDPHFAPLQLFLLATQMMECRLVGVEQLTLVIEQQATLIHVGHQIEEHLVDPVRQPARIEQLGHKDGGDVAHIVAHILQIVVEARLLLVAEGHQTDHPDTALVHHDGNPEEGALTAALLAGTTVTHRIIAGVGNDLLPLVINHIAQQAGIPLQLTSEELAIGPGASHPNHIGIHNLDLKLQHTRQHLGKAQDGRLDLHQQTLVAHGSHPSFLFVLVILPLKGVMLARY